MNIFLPLGSLSEKAMAPHSSTLAWKITWMEEPGGLRSMGWLRVGHDWATSLSLFTFHFHALEKGMATHSSIFAWRIPGTGEPSGLPSMGSHRVGHDWSDLAAVAGAGSLWELHWINYCLKFLVSYLSSPLLISSLLPVLLCCTVLCSVMSDSLKLFGL